MLETLRAISDKGCKVQHLSDAMKLAIDTVHNHPDDREKMNGALCVLDFAVHEMDKLGTEIERICLDTIHPMVNGKAHAEDL